MEDYFRWRIPTKSILNRKRFINRPLIFSFVFDWFIWFFIGCFSNCIETFIFSFQENVFFYPALDNDLKDPKLSDGWVKEFHLFLFYFPSPFSFCAVWTPVYKHLCRRRIMRAPIPQYPSLPKRARTDIFILFFQKNFHFSFGFIFFFKRKSGYVCEFIYSFLGVLNV